MEIVCYPSFSVGSINEELVKEKLFTEIHEHTSFDDTFFQCKKNQIVLKRIFQPLSDIKGILIFHKMGSGKTDCAAIIYDCLSSIRKKCIFLTKGDTPEAAVKQNILDWIQRYKKFGLVDSKNYLKDKFEFHHFQTFAKMCDSNATNVASRYENCVFVIDEAHNLRTNYQWTSGTQAVVKKQTYEKINKMLKKVKNSTIVLMTGTPMYNTYNEIIDILKLVHANDNHHAKELEDLARNKVSVFSISGGDIPQYEYVITDECKKLKNKNIIKYDLVVLPMKLGSEQQKQFIEFTNNKLTDRFSRKQQVCSLAAFPPVEQLSAENLHQLMFKKDMQFNKTSFTNNYTTYYNSIIYENNKLCLENLSIKLAYLKRTLESIECRGPCYIFSELVKGIGVEWIARMLQVTGTYEICTKETSFTSNETNGKRILLLTNEHAKNFNDDVRRQIDIFNSPENADGSRIKAIIGSDITGESMTLKNVSDVFIMFPHWNIKKLLQCETRCIRMNSHSALDPSSRHVRIHRLCVVPNDGGDQYGVDVLKYDISYKKEQGILTKEKYLKDVAIDKYLYQTNEQPEINNLYLFYYKNNYMELFETKIIDIYNQYGGDFHIEFKDLVTQLDVHEKVAHVLLKEFTKCKMYIIFDETKKCNYLEIENYIKYNNSTNVKALQIKNADNTYIIYDSLGGGAGAAPINWIEVPQDYETNVEELSYDIEKEFNIFINLSNDYERIYKLKEYYDTYKIKIISALVRLLIERRDGTRAAAALQFLKVYWYEYNDEYYEISVNSIVSNASYAANKVPKPDNWTKYVYVYLQRVWQRSTCLQTNKIISQKVYNHILEQNKRIESNNEKAFIVNGRLLTINLDDSRNSKFDSKRGKSRGLCVDNLKKDDKKLFYLISILDTIGPERARALQMPDAGTDAIDILVNKLSTYVKNQKECRQWLEATRAANSTFFNLLYYYFEAEQKKLEYEYIFKAIVYSNSYVLRP